MPSSFSELAPRFPPSLCLEGPDAFVAAIDGEGASDHDGHDQVGNGPIGDVIPPVPVFNDGKNWQNNWWPGDVVTEDLCVGVEESPYAAAPSNG